MDPSRWDAQVIQFKALVRLEDWAAAEKVLAQIEKRGWQSSGSRMRPSCEAKSEMSFNGRAGIEILRAD